jgi:group I intron endonuclease
MNLNIPCIYGIYNRKSGKWYIGQTNNFRKRKNNHLQRLAKGTHRNMHLLHSYKKHGPAELEFTILEEVRDQGARNIAEVVWIQFFSSQDKRLGYNLESGGNAGKSVSPEVRERNSERNRGANNPWFGKHLSPETRAKISAFHKNRVRPAEEIERLRTLNLNRGPVTAETRLKMSLAAKGRQKTETTCKRLSESLRGRTFSDEHKRHIAESWTKWKAEHPGYSRRWGPIRPKTISRPTTKANSQDQQPKPTEETQ